MEAVPSDIHKVGGILIRDRKLLVCRSRGKNFFVAPGGKVEAGETVQEALIRELYEELAIDVSKEQLSPFGIFYAAAQGERAKALRMDVFWVSSWKGEPTPSGEIDEMLWTSSHPDPTVTIGSVFAHDVIPRLLSQGVMD